ncbi:MAG: hypothetical protein RM021_026210 [Nostoc sp. EkiNYC01]|nr:hypothetical protein [Nostoc sp. EkiNYC01]
MPKSYEQFRYSDWEWIAVHFPLEERQDMAKTASLIAQCPADEITKHKSLDPRIVIPLCAIEFQDELDWEKLRQLKQEIEQNNFEITLKLLNSISDSERWKALFLSLEFNLQRDLLYRLSDSYRSLEHNDWRDIFLDFKKYEFLRSWHYRLVLSFTLLFILFCIIEMNKMIFNEYNFGIYLLIGLGLYILIGFWASSLLNPQYFIKFGFLGLLTFLRELYQLLSSNLINSNIEIFLNKITTEAVLGTVTGNLFLGVAVGRASTVAIVLAIVVSVPFFSVWTGALLGKVSWGMALIWAVTGIFILAAVGIATGAAGASTVAMLMSVPVFVVGFGGLFGKINQGKTLVFAAGAVAMTEAGALVGTVAGGSTVVIIGTVAVFVLGVAAVFRRVSWIWVMATAMIGTLILARVVAGASTVAMVGVRFGIFTGVLLSIGKLSWYGRKDNQNYFRFLAIFTLPLFCWFPILVSFATIFFLRFLSWQHTLLIWLISLGICTGLWLYGQDKERRARNPLKDILPLHNQV